MFKALYPWSLLLPVHYITGYSLLIQCVVIYRVKLDRASHTDIIVYLLGDHIANIFVQACYQRLSNLSTVVRGGGFCLWVVRMYVGALGMHIITNKQLHNNYTVLEGTG